MPDGLLCVAKKGNKTFDKEGVTSGRRITNGIE